MTDKKLTDAEIVKALEEHYKQVDKGYSTHLEYGGKGDEHEEKYIYMLRDILDLINRLQEENERLNTYFDVIDCSINKIKTEAYKEFAEKLKKWFRKENEVYKLIDNIVKELAGDN